MSAVEYLQHLNQPKTNLKLIKNTSAANLQRNSTATLGRVTKLTPTKSRRQGQTNGKNRVALRSTVRELSQSENFQYGGPKCGYAETKTLKAYSSRTTGRRDTSVGFP
ncbi:unnamed protein product [Euphydryas editha]|uniref:Uncharacterized protein n=1 Tax=Euphydryas editha TaxID=104508 RepID=A0AAU9V4A4_EUPED|nr:unnamed protein product [Euphydryas editha]